MLMLKGARLIDPASRTDEIKDVLISSKKITKIGEDLIYDAAMIARAKGERLDIIDCEGLVLAPGLIDVHVHFREPGFTYKEDIYTASNAAKAGGFTCIVGMANTKPSIDNEATLQDVIIKGCKMDIRVKSCANITKSMAGKDLVDMKLLKEAGAIAFTDDGLPLMDADLVKTAMRKARELKAILSFHEEDHSYIKEHGINAGEVAKKLGLEGAQDLAEAVMVERDCKLAAETGATICIQHISSKKSVDIVRKAKKNGVRVYAEATPHHFSLTEEAVFEFATLAKMNPPLRTEEDRLAIIEGLKDGTINIIATDHAPHSKEEKERDFVGAPSGIIGLETSLALGIMNLVDKGHISLSKLISRMSYEPARLYNLDGGCIREDAVADLVLFDPEKEWVYDETRSKSTNSPWFGKKLKGKVMMTICDGFIVYDAR